MTITFTTTRRDILALSAVTYLRSIWTYILLAAFAVVTLPGTIDVLDPQFAGLVNVLTAATIELALVAGLVLLMAVLVAVSTLVSARQGLVRRSMTFNPESLREEAPDHTVVAAWSGVHKVTRSRNYIYVYLQRTLMPNTGIERTASALD